MSAKALTTVVESSQIDQAIYAWLDAKKRHSGSEKTYKAYSDTLFDFRALLRQTGRDLDPFLNVHENSEEARRHAFSEIGLAAQGFAALSVVEKRKVSEATYNQRLAILSSFYTFANKRGFLFCGNPIASVERARVQSYQHAQPLEVEEVAERMQAIDRTTKQGARDYAMLAVLLQTGRRLSEVIDLRWRNVILKGSRITLVFEHCKGGKVMRDTIPPAVSNALLEWLTMAYGPRLRGLHGDAPLWISFTRRSVVDDEQPGVVPPPLTIRSVANICEKHLGVSKVHVTRHTWARTMEDAGAKVSDIQARLGHESLATTGRYLAALKQAENQHADTLAARFGLA
ncbi:MAG TPA: site-specific integrase [Ktedonobacteraceae bacterium]|jgi:integrase|nr:site-specific integrase [Ktedonobacteraceae bacterium]